MKTRLNIILTFILFVLLTSCSNRDFEPEVIKVNIDNKNRELLNVHIEKVIPIETNQNSLLGFITKAEYFNNRYYFIDALFAKTFFVYSEDGSFINKTIIGKGPGEVIDAFGFTINKEDSLIILYDQAKGSILNFDLELNYINSQKIEHSSITDLYNINSDSSLIFHSLPVKNYPKKKQYHSYALYTENFTKKHDFDILLNSGQSSLGLLSPVSINKNEVLFVSPFNYNIYQIINGKPRIQFVLDFGKYNIIPNKLSKLNVKEVWEEMSQGIGVGYIECLFHYEDFLVFETRFRNKDMKFFHSFESKKIYCLNDCFESNLIPDCRIWGIRDDGVFYATVEPDKLLQFQKSSGQYKDLKVNEENNPYVILFKINEPK